MNDFLIATAMLVQCHVSDDPQARGRGEPEAVISSPVTERADEAIEQEHIDPPPVLVPIVASDSLGVGLEDAGAVDFRT